MLRLWLFTTPLHSEIIFSLCKFLEHLFSLQFSLKASLSGHFISWVREDHEGSEREGYFGRGMRDRLKEKLQNMLKPIKRPFNDVGKLRLRKRGSELEPCQCE